MTRLRRLFHTTIGAVAFAAASSFVPAAAASQPARPAQATGGTAAPPAAAIDFAMGNISFLLFHEVGHALISEFELPVLGREEDAVDNFASVFLAPDEGDPAENAKILTDTVTGWFAYAEMTAFDEIEWWAAHGPDRQRAYQIACLLYGSKAGAYDGLAEEIELPEERRESCPAEYQAVLASWTRLLGPHIIADGGAAAARITVRYEPSGAFATEERLLRESELMETMATEVAGTFRLPRALTIKAAVCEEPNSYWSSDDAEITICYELVRDYIAVHAQLQAPAGGPAEE